MEDKERLLLIESAKEIFQLFNDRDDMVVGITAALLDLYRVDFSTGRQTKSEALLRLSTQRLDLEGRMPRQLGAKYLGALIETLRDDKLDAAKLAREPAAGSA
jgi:hypothetical protein